MRKFLLATVAAITMAAGVAHAGEGKTIFYCAIKERYSESTKGRARTDTRDLDPVNVVLKKTTGSWLMTSTDGLYVEGPGFWAGGPGFTSTLYEQDTQIVATSNTPSTSRYLLLTYTSPTAAAFTSTSSSSGTEFGSTYMKKNGVCTVEKK